LNQPNVFNTLFNPLQVQQFQRYLPTAFDEGMTLLEKVNKVIIYLNQIGKITNDVLDQWNQVMDWVMADGLDASVDAKLEAMMADGAFTSLIEQGVFTDFTNRLNQVEKNEPIQINDAKYGADVTGVQVSTSALQSALNDGGIIQLPEVCNLLIDSSFVLNAGQEIHGKGRDSVITLKGNITLFDLQSSGVVLKNFRILVPDANTNPVIKTTVQPNKAQKYCDVDVWIESVGTNGSWTGFQMDMTTGFLLYKCNFDLKMQYPNTGIELIGNGGVTGCDFNVELAGFNTAMNLNGSDSFEGNRIKGEIQDLRDVDTKGVYMVKGFGNRFDLNCWYDSNIGKFYPVWFESATHNNLVEGHLEGRYVDNGDNLINAEYYKWDFSVTPRSSNPKADYRDLLNNTLPAPVNVLQNPSFSIGNNAGWIGFDGRVTMTRDSATFGYTCMKLTATSTDIGWGYQMVDDWEQYKGKTLYAGCWVFVSSNNQGNGVSGISISDGISTGYSDLAVKNGNWQWVTAKKTISDSATSVSMELGRVDGSLSKVNAVNDVVYFTKPVLMMGGKIRPQNHVPQKRLLKFTPVSGNTGKKGDQCFDDSYLYVWTDDNVVKRTALTTF
jgi:hypothetical protein